MLKKALGTRINLSIAYHPQTDSQMERMIQTLQYMLRLCAIKFNGNWDTYFPLIEFFYNNSYLTSIQYTLYEALYGHMCRLPLCWFEIEDRQLTRIDLIQETTDKIAIIRDKLKISKDHHKSYAKNSRIPLQFQIGDKVLLNVLPWQGLVRFGTKRKLNHRYVEPFEIIKMIGTAAYKLKSP